MRWYTIVCDDPDASCPVYRAVEGRHEGLDVVTRVRAASRQEACDEADDAITRHELRTRTS